MGAAAFADAVGSNNRVEERDEEGGGEELREEEAWEEEAWEEEEPAPASMLAPVANVTHIKYGKQFEDLKDTLPFSSTRSQMSICLFTSNSSASFLAIVCIFCAASMVTPFHQK